MLAKIYRPAKTAMQSGKAGAKRWVLELEPAIAARVESLMGWVSGDSSNQVRLRFDTKEQAIEFARENNLPHEIAEPPEPKRFPKAYGDNFAFRRKEPWSH